MRTKTSYDKGAKASASLALTKLHFFKLDSLALGAHDSLKASIALAHRLFKILTLFNSQNQAGLLNAAVKPPY